MEKYTRCVNSLNGKHEWLEKRDKNKNKPDQCVLCRQQKSKLAVKD